MKKIIIKLKNKIAMLKQNQHDSVSYGKEPAFALANVLIILTFIAVIMALAAPILSRPSNIDEKNLVKKLDENTFYVANGNAQTFNVGGDNIAVNTTTQRIINKLNVNHHFNTYDGGGNIINRADTMHVFGNLRVIGVEYDNDPNNDIHITDLNSRVRIDETGFNFIKIARNGDDSDITIDNPVPTDDDGNIIGELLFNLSPNKVITGLNIIPSYTPETVTTRFQAGSYVSPKDGYLLIENAISANYNNEFYINKLNVPRSKNFTKLSSSSTGGKPFNTNTDFNIMFNEKMQLTTYPILIPIQKGQDHICALHGGTSNCRFISLSDTFNIDNPTQIYGTTIAPSP